MLTIFWKAAFLEIECKKNVFLGINIKNKISNILGIKYYKELFLGNNKIQINWKAVLFSSNIYIPRKIVWQGKY